MVVEQKVVNVMNPENPRWDEFADRLYGPEGCDFRRDKNGDPVWRCGGGRDKTRARRILEDMRMDVEASCAFFEERGGYCDCEIIMNLDK